MAVLDMAPLWGVREKDETMKRKELLIAGGTSLLAACAGGGMPTMIQRGREYVRSTATGALLINRSGVAYAELKLVATSAGDVLAQLTPAHIVYSTMHANEPQDIGEGFTLTTNRQGGVLLFGNTRASVTRGADAWEYTGAGLDHVRVASPRQSLSVITTVCGVLKNEWNWAFALLLLAGAIWAAEPLDPLAAAAFTAETINLQHIQSELVINGCPR